MKRILIVDDEMTVRMGLSKLVKDYHSSYYPVAVPNGVEALAEIHKHRPEVLLTDISMPKMDGLELCRQVQELGYNLPVAVISGYDDFRYAQKCIHYGVKEYLLKPITEHELYPVLDTLLKESDASKPFSIFKMEEWLDQAESAIWSADFKTLSALIDHWKNDVEITRQPLPQIEGIVIDCLRIMVKKLNARGMASFAVHPVQKKMNALSDAVTYLESEMIHLYNQLFQWRGGNQKNIFEEAKMYIDSHLAEEVSLEEVADKMGLTPTYFSYIFRKMTNETFVQYRMRKRIEFAKQLLEHPHYKVIDICLEVGYQNYSYFTKIFKKWTGVSPSEYRSMLGMK